MLRKLFIILLVIAFGSCKKVGKGAVEGHVYSKTTGSGIPGCKMLLVRTFHGNQGDILTETTTDASGYYKLDFKFSLLANYQYYVYAEANNQQEKELTSKKNTVDFYY